MAASETCPCHGEPWYVQPGGKQAGKRLCIVKRRASNRAGAIRYAQTEKGRARSARYASSEKGRATRARYRENEKGRAAEAERNARRVYVGMYYVGRTLTAESAAIINQHTRDHFKRKAADV